MERQGARCGFALAFWMLWLVNPAWADLEICNDTYDSQSVAIGYKLDGGWVSEGWWQLEPEACVSPILGPLKFRFYYYLAQGDGWKFDHDRVSFCTQADVFTIRGDGGCEQRGYDRSYFAKIDVGKGAAGYTQLVGEHSTLSSKGAESETAQPAEGVWGIPYRGEAIFHGCTSLFQRAKRTCFFVGGGRKFNVLEDGRTSEEIFEVIDLLAPGDPVRLEGDWAGRFDTTVDVVLRHLETRPANAEDLILKRLQGNWYSVKDANDQFKVFGSGRQNSYDGSLTSMEYLSVMRYCGEFDSEGPYLYTWDSQGGTGLCYVVKELTDNDLVLNYLPRGTELRYRKLGP
ncbi:putative integral membrane protein [Phaeobacter sp. CECT 5382]|nr:putative integral membrane protein [Phaeobacter sp. CECT 5382]